MDEKHIPPPTVTIMLSSINITRFGSLKWGVLGRKVHDMDGTLLVFRTISCGLSILLPLIGSLCCISETSGNTTARRFPLADQLISSGQRECFKTVRVIVPTSFGSSAMGVPFNSASRSKVARSGRLHSVILPSNADVANRCLSDGEKTRVRGFCEWATTNTDRIFVSLRALLQSLACQLVSGSKLVRRTMISMEI